MPVTMIDDGFYPKVERNTCAGVNHEGLLIGRSCIIKCAGNTARLSLPNATSHHIDKIGGTSKADVVKSTPFEDAV